MAVVQKSLSTGVNVDGMLKDLQALGMRIEPFLPVDGERAQARCGRSRDGRACRWAIGLSEPGLAAGPHGCDLRSSWSSAAD